MRSNVREHPSAKIVELIKMTVVIGKGEENDPVRRVNIYYDLDGTYMFDDDTEKESEGK